ncbi:hypothetical protein ACHAWF_008796 [Thalassiosira exigua]
MSPSAAEAMLAHLRSRGFARISLRPDARPWIRDSLHAACVRDAASMDGFRFPPPPGEGPTIYDDSKRRAFRALFKVATCCLSGLLGPLDGRGGGTTASARAEANAYALVGALRRVRDGGGDFGLFRRDDDEPFEPGQPFSQSFFNLFNYDHGSLNAHVDRSLLTVIYSYAPKAEAAQIGTLEPPPEGALRSALWVKDPRGKWRNADLSCDRDHALVLVGEDLEGVGIASALGVVAAEHAVRVDPTGPRIERSHFQRDPACAGKGPSRRSAAMILRHEPDGL